MFWFDVDNLAVHEVTVLRVSASSTRDDLMRVHDVDMPAGHYYAVQKGWLRVTPKEAIQIRLGDLDKERLKHMAKIEIAKAWLKTADEFMDGCFESAHG